MRLDQLAIFNKSKDIFGAPYKGVHSFRIMDVAVVDYVATIFGAFTLYYFTGIPVEICTILLFFLGIVAHILFGVDTATNRWLKQRF